MLGKHINERNFVSTSNILGLNPNSSFIKFVTDSKLLYMYIVELSCQLSGIACWKIPGQRLMTRKPSVSSFHRQTLMEYLRRAKRRCRHRQTSLSKTAEKPRCRGAHIPSLVAVVPRKKKPDPTSPIQSSLTLGSESVHTYRSPLSLLLNSVILFFEMVPGKGGFHPHFIDKNSET